MKKLLILMFSLSSLFGCKKNSEAIKKVDVATFKELLETKKDVQLIDVRTQKEHDNGHIKKSYLIDYYSDDFNTKLELLDKSKPVFLYCRSGKRSAKSAQIMADLGFKDITDLKGGFNAWNNQ